MIRRVRIDYKRRKPPGTLVICTDRKGRIVFERDKRPENKRVEFERSKKE